MKKTKVCHLTSAHQDNDVRIFHKECVSLASAGFDVSLVVPNAQSRVENNVKIVSFESTHHSRIQRMTRTVIKTYKHALKENAKIYHFQDPELMLIGVLLKLKGKRVFYDVHEDVPQQILDKKWLGPSFIRSMVSLGFRMIQWFCCLFFDHIFTATPEISKRFNSKKTTTVYNYPIVTYLQEAKPIEYSKEKPSVVYAGGLTKLRGIKELIKGVGELEGRVELWLIGEWETPEFQQECEALDGFTFTKYFGKMPLQEVYRYYKMADFGAHTVYPSDRHLIGIPTKILECMAIGMPVILTDGSYWRDFFNNFASFVDAMNPSNIAEKIQYLLDNPKETATMAEGGKKFVLSECTWEMEKGGLINQYKSFSEN